MTTYDTLLSLIMEHSRSDIGYDQAQRWTWLDKANRKIVPHKEGDCSAVTIGLCWLAGYAVPSANVASNQTCYTGNAYDLLHTAAGFKATPVAGWTVAQINAASVPGCPLLKDGHIMIKAPVAGDQWYSMNMDENGRITGGAAGDSTGNESSIRSLWMPSIGWQYIFTPPDAPAAGSSAAKTAATNTPTTSGASDTVTTVTQKTTPTPGPGLTSGTTLVANSATNVRTGPGTSYTAVSSLPPNTVVTGVLVDGWIKITVAPSNLIGNYVSTAVLGTVTTTPASSLPTSANTQGQATPTTTTTTRPSTGVTTTTTSGIGTGGNTPIVTTRPPNVENPDVPVPPAAQNIVGLSTRVVKRLQTRLNERLRTSLTLDGSIEDDTILAWQKFVGTAQSGLVGYPSEMVKATQARMNSDRALAVSSGSALPAAWKVVPEDGVWSYATAASFSAWVLYWDGWHV